MSLGRNRRRQLELAWREEDKEREGRDGLTCTSSRFWLGTWTRVGWEL